MDDKNNSSVPSAHQGAYENMLGMAKRLGYGNVYSALSALSWFLNRENEKPQVERAQGEGLTDEQIIELHDSMFPRVLLDSERVMGNVVKFARAILASQPAPTLGSAPQAEQHSDDIAVDRFAAAMKDKMAKSRAKGRGGWDDPAQCGTQDLADMLVDHIEKGDPVDIGNFAMMLWNRGAWAGDLVSALSQYVMRESRAPQQQATVPEYLREFVDAVAHNYTVYDEESDETYCRGCSALIPYGDCHKTAHQPGCIVPRAQSMLAAAPSPAPAQPVATTRYEGRLKRLDGSWSNWYPLVSTDEDGAEAWAKSGGYAFGAEWRKAQPVAQEGEQTCTWTYHPEDCYWHTRCGQDWTIISGSPNENHMTYCHGCGKRLVQVHPTTTGGSNG